MKKHRAELLAKLLKDRFNNDRNKLIDHAGLTKGRISQMLDEGFGERAARALEEKLELADRYFEGGDPTQSSAFADLNAFESALITVVRSGLTLDELRQLTEAVNTAVKTKAIRVSTGQPVGTLGVYFGVDRRSTEVDVADDRRELLPWENKKRARKKGRPEGSST